VRNNDLAKLTFALNNDANFRIVNNKGQTPLHTINSKTDLAVVSLLVDRGASLTATDNFGTTLLECAVLSSPEIVKYLLQKGVPVIVNERGCRALNIAASSGLARKNEIYSILLNEIVAKKLLI
jgi:ankyrin repeat protein